MFTPGPVLTCLWTLALCCVLSGARAQVTCIPVFIKEYTGAGQTEPQAVKALPDGTFLVVGRATPTAASTSYNGYVAKLSATGALQWAYLMGGSGGGPGTTNDIFTGLTLLNDGGALLYGATGSFGHPEGKAWLVRIDAAGNVLWSRQLGSGVTGTDRMKAVMQYSDGDLVGTLNINDSSSLSDPIVFKMGLDGTLRWAHRFDNGDDDSFTSIAFSGDTLYTGGYYTQSGAQKAVITRIKAEDGTFLSSVNVYRDDDTFLEEITGLEVYNQQISWGLWEHKGTDPDFNENGMVLVQTDLSDHPQFVRYAEDYGDLTPLRPLRTPDDGFLLLRAFKGSDGAPTVFYINHYGSTVWGVSLTAIYYNETNWGLDITPDGGFVAAGFYSVWTTGYLNLMHLVKANAAGAVPASCNNWSPGLFTDTLGYNEQPLQWSVQTAFVPGLNESVSPAQPVFTPVLTSDCDSSICVDKTPLPPGCNKTYRIEYGGDQASFFRDVAPSADGGMVAAGEYFQDGFIMKVRQNGDVAWAKSYEQFFHNTLLRRIIPSQDGNYFAMGVDGYVLNHGVSEDNVLIKLDNNGNILWSKNITLGGGYEEHVADIAATPDGGLIMLDDAGVGSGGTYGYVVRFDANGNFVWQKNISYTVETPIFRSITCSADAIYILSDTYANGVYQNDKFGVYRLDLATGNQVWARRYSIGTTSLAHANRVCTINDSAYVFLYDYTQPPFYTAVTNIMVVIDPQGNLVQSSTLLGDPLVGDNWFLDFLDVTPPTVTLTPDQDFIFCQPVVVGGDSILNMTRMERNGTVLWSRTYPGIQRYTPYNIHPMGKGFIVAGAAAYPYTPYGFQKAFMLKLDSSGQVQPGATADCQPEDRPFSVVPYPGVTLYISPWPEAVVDIQGQLQPASVLIQDVSYDATLFCYSPANCNAVTLQQKGTVCSTADTLVYFLDNSANCGAAATWTYDPAYFKAAMTTGDSIRLVPLQPGSSQVSAQIEGYCSLTTQQKTAAVVFSSTPVNLGPDTLLCKNSQLTLHAGPGFSSYLWNDNSTDSTLQVSAPGKYYVTTTDACGDPRSDTVLVNPANFIFQLWGDSVSCNDEPVLLQATAGYTNYQWSPNAQLNVKGDDSALVDPVVPTRYYVRIQKWPGCILIDSLTVTPLGSPSITFPHDTTLCTGDSLLLDAGPAFSHYTWNNGDSSQQIFVEQAGTYSIAALYSNGCISRDTFQLSLYKDPQPSLDKDPVLCIGTDRQLNAGAGYAQYLWSDSSAGSSLTVVKTGTYWVKVTDQHGCTGSDTAHILSMAPPPSGFLPPDTTICQYGDLKLTTLKGYSSYTWSDLSSGASLTISSPGLYWVEVTDNNGCTARDSIEVTQKTCLLGLFVPNAFTPDHNGHNDRFRPLLYGDVAHFEFTVLNRWGQRMFTTQALMAGWDGTINGTPAPAGTYVWYCRYQLSGQPEKLEKGTVILIR